MTERSVKDIVVSAQSKKGTVHEILEKRKANMSDELENSQIERMLLEEKERIRALQNSGQPVGQTQAHDFATLLLGNRKPEEIKQILESLDESHIEKLALISAAMSNNQLGLVSQLLNKPDRSVKDTLELVEMITKMNQKPAQESGITLQGIAALMKEIRESTATGQPKTQESGTEKYMNMLLEELKMARQENQRERELKLEREIDQLKNRPSAMDELTQDAQKLAKYRTLFGAVDQGTANEYTLKKEEMQQTERLETRKLDFEQEKWKYEKENSGKTIEQVKDLVKTVTEGPVGEVIKSFGSAGADRLRAGTAQKTPSNIVTVKCPSCGGQFPANGQLPTVTCPLCGVTLQAPGQPPPQSQPPPASEQSQKPQGAETTVEQGQ
jgi:hypothetical protein